MQAQQFPLRRWRIVDAVAAELQQLEQAGWAGLERWTTLADGTRLTIDRTQVLLRRQTGSWLAWWAQRLGLRDGGSGLWSWLTTHDGIRPILHARGPAGAWIVLIALPDLATCSLAELLSRDQALMSQERARLLADLASLLRSSAEHGYRLDGLTASDLFVSGWGSAYQPLLVGPLSTRQVQRSQQPPAQLALALARQHQFSTRELLRFLRALDGYQ
jgi:hypothetical protein